MINKTEILMKMTLNMHNHHFLHYFLELLFNHFLRDNRSFSASVNAFIKNYPSGAPEFTPWFLVGFMLLDLLFYVYCFVDRCLSFSSVSFGHCVDCPCSINGFWLPLWYLQTLLLSPQKFTPVLYCIFIKSLFMK